MIRIDLSASLGLGKAYKSVRSKARVSVRETEIGTGIMVRHGNHLLLCPARRRMNAAQSGWRSNLNLSNACGLVHLGTLKDESYKGACVE